jgi:hypothetical protein
MAFISSSLITALFFLGNVMHPPFENRRGSSPRLDNAPAATALVIFQDGSELTGEIFSLQPVCASHAFAALGAASSGFVATSRLASGQAT